jgi:hypothetical protein
MKDRLKIISPFGAMGLPFRVRFGGGSVFEIHGGIEPIRDVSWALVEGP